MNDVIFAFYVACILLFFILRGLWRAVFAYPSGPIAGLTLKQSLRRLTGEHDLNVAVAKLRAERATLRGYAERAIVAPLDGVFHARVRVSFHPRELEMDLAMWYPAPSRWIDRIKRRYWARRGVYEMLPGYVSDLSWMPDGLFYRCSLRAKPSTFILQPGVRSAIPYSERSTIINWSVIDVIQRGGVETLEVPEIGGTSMLARDLWPEHKEYWRFFFLNDFLDTARDLLKDTRFKLDDEALTQVLQRAQE